MTKILHIIKNYCYAGASRSISAIAKNIKQIGPYEHTVISLLPGEEAREVAEDAGMRYLAGLDKESLYREIASADMVQVDWWNNPPVYEFLRANDLPPMRMVLFVHVAGVSWPNIMIPQLVDIADFVVAGCQFNYQCPVIRGLPENIRSEKTDWVSDTTDFDRLDPLVKKPHPGFNIGYIGTADFVKMHPDFIRMSAAVNIPGVKFSVCGRGDMDLLRSQADQLNVAHKFEFKGFVQDIRSEFEVMDVFGYPLCDPPGAELALQDALYAGIPAVVFPLGGIRDAVIHNYNGLHVESHGSYSQALEYLYHHPEELERMSENAKKHAREVFGGFNSAKRFHRIYQRVMELPKTTRQWSTQGLPASIDKHSGMGKFVESIGAANKHFITSVTGKDDPEIIAAEAWIGTGNKRNYFGLSEYRQYYPADSYLRLWEGLALYHMQEYPEAYELIKSAATGIDHWRLSWYMAQVAFALDLWEEAQKNCRVVLMQAPEFQPARLLEDQLKTKAPGQATEITGY